MSGPSEKQAVELIRLMSAWLHAGDAVRKRFLEDIADPEGGAAKFEEARQSLIEVGLVSS